MYAAPVQDEEIDQILSATLDDAKMSRGERKALREHFGALSPEEAARFRARAFALARSRSPSALSHALIDWLEESVKLSITPPHEPRAMVRAEARFSPGLDCLDRIVQSLEEADAQVDICVFTITDDRIARQILAAKARGVSIRVITDNEKSLDRGSDIARLEEAGIDVRIDETEHHMHHKFAVFDRRLVLTGSYNWTRSAADFNLENIVLTDHPELVSSFAQVFDRLWNELRPR